MQSMLAQSFPPVHNAAQLDPLTGIVGSASLQQTEPAAGQSENPFSCNICKRTYSRIDHLARHYRSHTLEKPFSCHLCDKDFGRADLLKRHVAGHDEEFPKKKKQKTAASTANPRVSQACTACAEAKLKCEQKKPCGRCQQRNIVCQFTPSKRRAVPPSPSLSDSQRDSARQLSSSNDLEEPLSSLQSTMQKSNAEDQGADRHVFFESAPMEIPPSLPPDDTFQTTPLDTDALLDFENSSFADFLRDIMMPLSPSAGMGIGVDSADQSFTTRDVLNFGVATTWDLPPFEPSFPLQMIDEYSQVQPYPRPELQGQVIRPPQSGARTPDFRNNINLGAQAFNESLWRWVPAQNDHGYAEQTNLSLPPDVDLSKASLAFGSEMVEPRISQSARDRILAVVLSTCQQTSFARVVSSFPSAEILTRLLHNFIDFHSKLADSWIHLPTIKRDQSRPELLAIMVASGAVLSGVQAIRKLGFALQEVVRLAVPKLFESDNTLTRDLQVLQAYALQLDIGLWSGDRRKMEIAESHAQPLVTMMRRAGHYRRPKQGTNIPTEEDEGEVLDTKWRNWAAMEAIKRLVFHLVIRDAQTSISLLVPPLISYAEVTIDMPAAQELWTAPTALDWKRVYLDLAPLLEERLPSLPRCIHDTSPLSRLQKAIDIRLSTLIVLYGISTLIWEYRQLNSVVKLHPSTHWNSGLITTSLHQELTQLLHHFHMAALDWGPDHSGLSTSATLAYERSLLNLHVSFEDLQFFAGKEGEYEARRVYPLLKQWADSRESRQAVWHAGQVIRAAKKYQPHTLRDAAAIALYHASLALWAYAVVGNVVKVGDKRNHSGESGGLSINDASPPGMNENTLVWLDGEDDGSVQRFLKLNRGIPAIRRWSDQSELGYSNEYAMLSQPGVVMEIVIQVLRKKSRGEDKSCPPLVENLCLLMRSLGNAARGIRKV